MLHCEGNERQGSLLDKMMDWTWVDEYQDFIPVEQLSTQFVLVYPNLCDLLGAKVTPSVVLNDPLPDGEITNVFKWTESQMRVAMGEAQTTQKEAKVANIKDEPLEVEGMEEDHDGVIWVPAKLYQPPLPSLYREPELGSDLNNGMDWMFKEYRCAVKQSVGELTPRDDVLEFEL